MWGLIIVQRFGDIMKGFIIVEAFVLGLKGLLHSQGITISITFACFYVKSIKTISLTSRERLTINAYLFQIKLLKIIAS